jgi:hypothetical protein
VDSYNFIVKNGAKIMHKHPIQPILEDNTGTLRFKENTIVSYLLEAGPLNLNMLAAMPFSQEDREQFAQLIGYSLSGFGELSYVRDDTYQAAYNMAKADITEEQAQIDHLQSLVDSLRNKMVEPMAELYGKHPDDFS